MHYYLEVSDKNLGVSDEIWVSPMKVRDENLKAGLNYEKGWKGKGYKFCTTLN